jgi:hypothetical protein
MSTLSHQWLFSTAGVFLVWLSALAATFSYFTVLPVAGQAFFHANDFTL